jgi:glycosyltransferase involved in cell wall biosynthesis
MARVSVVMCVRDGLPFLGEAVDSVLAQSLEDLELVAVDDGSTDGSLELLAQRASRDGRIRVLRSPGRGIVDALNRGVAAARTPLVARMDADDVCEPHRLRRQLERMRRPDGPDVVGTGAAVISDGPSPGLEAYHRWLASLDTAEALRRECLVESPLVHSSVMADRRLLAAHRYRSGAEAGITVDPGAVWPEDYDLWLRLLRAGARILNLPEPLVRVRVHPRRVTRERSYSPAALAPLKLHHLLCTRLARRPPVVVQGAGRHGKMWARLLVRASVPVTALLDVSPRRRGKRMDGLPVHAVEDLPGLDRELVLVAVGQKGPNTRRAEVRAQLAAQGLVEGDDYVFVC